MAGAADPQEELLFEDVLLYTYNQLEERIYDIDKSAIQSKPEQNEKHSSSDENERKRVE